MLHSRPGIRHLSLVAFLVMISLPARSEVPQETASLWVEGESAGVKQVNRHAWYSDAVRKEQMSGEGWISHFSNDADGTAQYDLKVDKDGDYSLWVRGNPIGAALSYQVNGGAWVAVDTTKATDAVNLAQDDRADMRFLAWMKGGRVPLKKGPATLVFKMHSPVSHHGAIDCFVLTTGAFEPRGILKPGEVEPPPAVPLLGDGAVRKWIDFIRPGAEDLRWARLSWRDELGAAVLEAKKLQRPLLLWAMNGHPMACT
jgi:hypothetical protein